MKKSLEALVFLLILTLPLFAQIKDLTIEAEKVTVEKEKQQIEAVGSVEVAYKNFTMQGNHLIYNTSAETIYADRGFILNYQGLSIEGETLDYKIKERAGVATNSSFYYRTVRLGGGRLSFDLEEFQMKNASFTTCDIEPVPHYKVTAADIILYPEYGWLVAYWGYFWLGNIPVVPMPTYIYDFRAEANRQKNLPPFPAIGSNSDDGGYITETLAWHLRRELSGTYTLGYMANKGLQVGGTANYIVNNWNKGDLRLNWNGKDQTFGGITHLVQFGGEVAASGKDSFDIFTLPRMRQYELEMTLSSKERINYQHVSLTPDITLRSRSGEILRKEVKYDFAVSAGIVDEEGNIRLARAGGDLRLYGELPETAVGTFVPALDLFALYYSNGTHWIKPSAELTLSKMCSANLFLGLGYQHYFFIKGQSPFNYEMYRFRAADRLRPEAKFMIGETGAKIAASYYVDNWSPEDIDYTLFFKLHCYNLEATYRSMRNEFAVGVSLGAK